jgi:hydroxypyruvate isomerase
VMLVLEPLNTELFATMYLVSTRLGLDIVEAVDSPNLRLLYDVYHSRVMGEDVREVLAGRTHLVAHVQVAGWPGRNEPGTGDLDYADVMQALADLGYTGPIGLEYFPTTDSVTSIARAREALGG